MRYAWVENGHVINVIVWDGGEPLPLPESVTLIETAEANPGWCWDAESGFIAPPPDIEEE